MALRCLLFSSDGGTAQSICQLLSDLGIEAEHCPDAIQAVERISTQVFNLVIVDWDDEPEASSLLNAARGKKAVERPLNLAIVGQDASVPLALQAGANSILRKPINASQVQGTLTTARDLLRAKLDPPAPAVRVAAAAANSESPTFEYHRPEAAGSEGPGRVLHPGEFLQSGTTPSAHFVTEAEVPQHNDPVEGSEIDPLNELEPMAASVRQPEAVPQPPVREPEEPRGLAWYLKSRPAPVPAPGSEPAPGKTELISFSDAASFSGTVPQETATGSEPPRGAAPLEPAAEREKRTEAALFAHIAGETPVEAEPQPRSHFNTLAALGVVALIFVVAFLEAPPSLWRPQAKSLIAGAARATHNWLNPQPVTTAPAPASHENFGRAGDEYKLPVAESIPDASTDPTQIRVVPVVDPTIKPPKDPAAQPAPPNTDPKDNPEPTQSDPAQAQPNQVPPDPVQENPQGASATQPNPAIQVQPGTSHPPGNAPSGQTSDAPAQPAHPTAAPPTGTSRDPMQPLAQKSPQAGVTASVASNAIPSSLKSQMATSTPEASGNRPVESAMPSIEPVELPESTVRGLVLENPDPVYPDNARGQHGTVIVQVLIGRDGTVQDVKFQQGSLAFARSAIDAVKQWRFKPYTMNTRPVSVKTVVSLNFKPAA